jgi:signal transduction histidine kinase/CheY-like chemotaxis protein
MENDLKKLLAKTPKDLLNLPICMCEANSNGNIVWVNQLFLKTFKKELDTLANVKSIFPTIFSTPKISEKIKLPNLHYQKQGNRQSLYSIEVFPNKTNKVTSYRILLHNKTEIYTERKSKELLQNLATAELNSKDQKSLYQAIQKELNAVMDAQNMYIVLWDKLHHNLTFPYLGSEEIEENSFQPCISLFKYIIEGEKSTLLSQKDIFKLEDEGKIELYGVPAKACMAVPLKQSNEIIGLLVVQSFKSAKAYTHTDLLTLEFVSNQVAVSIYRKEYEVNLELAKDRAEEADRLKTSFLANMSHEIRTPMNSIVGFSELIARKNIPQTKKSIYAQYISNSSKALLTLIDDIIDISKIEAKQLKIIKSNVQVNGILAELFEFFENFIQSSGKENLRLKKHFAISDGNFSILCDSLRLRQVLNNLINNAIKFSDEGYVEFGYHLPNNATILFYVQDTGIGLSAEKSKLIFERFRQGDDSTTRKYGGTGLGLAISKKLVELMGGQIWVESEIEKGTTFFFSLPLIIPNISENIINIEKSQSISENFEGKIILVAEDEEINFLFLKEVILPTKAKVLRAHNGQEAIDAVKKNPNISLVLMDTQMPVMNGYQATKIIKSTHPHLPIITQTAYAMSEDRAKGFQAGSDEYLSKPIKPDLLIRTLRKFLNK